MYDPKTFIKEALEKAKAKKTDTMDTSNQNPFSKEEVDFINRLRLKSISMIDKLSNIRQLRITEIQSSKNEIKCLEKEPLLTTKSLINIKKRLEETLDKIENEDKEKFDQKKETLEEKKRNLEAIYKKMKILTGKKEEEQDEDYGYE